MKSTGIIMSGDHPVKVMNGTKTVTRRTAGLNHVNEMPDFWDYHRYDKDTNRYLFWQNQTGAGYWEVCPYGQAGDQLWVRERHCIDCYNKDKIKDACYYIDESPPYEINDCQWAKWRPSIYMPRWASRITLTISDIRPERLQDITEEDIIKEGVAGYILAPASHLGPEISGNREKFIELWDSLNAKRGYSFEFNPWVWRIEGGAMGVTIK